MSAASRGISALLSRDITPEDYDLLSALDAVVPKKGLTADELEAIPRRVCAAAAAAATEGVPTCSVCMEGLREGERLRAPLCCGAEFHATCLGRWLQSNCRCPVCNQDPTLPPTARCVAAAAPATPREEAEEGADEERDELVGR